MLSGEILSIVIKSMVDALAGGVDIVTYFNDPLKFAMLKSK